MAKITQLKNNGKIIIDGFNLDIADVVAVAKHNCQTHTDSKKGLVEGMGSSVKLLEQYLSNGYYVYAQEWTLALEAALTRERPTSMHLHSSLLQHTQSGVLTDADSSYDLGTHSMPVAWVRATMLVRCNNCLRGHSGVRLELIESLLNLLRNGLTPIIPLRGSISASGDLLPLSYIAGMLEGSPDILVRTGGRDQSPVVSAHEALRIAGLEPMVLGPKEGLGLINGTAASAAVGSLAAYETSQLATFSQILTAMTCEALTGNAESFHPFIAAVRPHPGQIETAGNILSFLQGSSLVAIIRTAFVSNSVPSTQQNVPRLRNRPPRKLAAPKRQENPQCPPCLQDLWRPLISGNRLSNLVSGWTLCLSS